jgi:hypothetical protein
VRAVIEFMEAIDNNFEAAWQEEIARHIQDIETGKVKTIPGKKFFERAASYFMATRSLTLHLEPVERMHEPSVMSLRARSFTPPEKRLRSG